MDYHKIDKFYAKVLRISYNKSFAKCFIKLKNFLKTCKTYYLFLYLLIA